MPSRQDRDARRVRASQRFDGRLRNGGECKTGHPMLFAMAPAFELGVMPEGGGYPEGFIQEAARLLGCADPATILHLCAGSVSAPLTIDIRPDHRPAIRADVRWLPIRPGSQRYILADPPYSPEYAEKLWDLRNAYPGPLMLLRECAQALAPGGRVGFLHHLVPELPPGLTRVGVWGVVTGVGYRIRAFTVAERTGDPML